MLARVFIFLIRLYQRAISPFLGPVCRFHPSCSHYAVACLELHGAGRGSWLTIRRLSRCHPFHPGGYDPPPLPKGAVEPDVTATEPADTGDDERAAPPA